MAEDFSENGFVYSICNPDWSPAMRAVAEMIDRRLAAPCYGKKQKWHKLSKQPAECEAGDCGESECDMSVRISRELNGSDDCPAELYESLSFIEAKKYTDRTVVVPVTTSNGEVTRKDIYCILPKLATPKDCAAARDLERSAYASRVGWYYCENSGEDFESACLDGKDNDGDDLTDCDDEECADCTVCGGADETCDNAKCANSVVLTKTAKDAITGCFIFLNCLESIELSKKQCSATKKASLGTPCVQPGYSDPEEDTVITTDGLIALSFQKGCDCMTYNENRGADVSYLSHFCTRPCSTSKKDCPVDFRCVDVFSDTFDVPDDLRQAYCVPDCVYTSCEESNERCVPTSASGERWKCQVI